MKNEYYISLKQLGWSDELIDRFMRVETDPQFQTVSLVELNAYSYETTNPVISIDDPIIRSGTTGKLK